MSEINQLERAKCFGVDGRIKPEYLEKIFNYDSASGELTYKELSRELIKDGLYTATGLKARNTQCAGKAALSGVDSSTGYRSGTLFFKKYSQHRVIVAMLTGSWPKEVDHISGVKTDNRLKNLRDAGHAENTKNTKVYKTSKSGRVGVLWRRSRRKWVAQIQSNGSKIDLGSFDCFLDACAARCKAEAEHGFHPNHGRAV